MNPFKIYFSIAGGRIDYAFKSWPGVPRVGESVILNKGGALTEFEVTKVAWGIEVKHKSHIDDITLQVNVKELKQ